MEPWTWAEGCRAGTLLTRGSGQASAPPSGHVAMAQFQYRLCHTLSEDFLVSQQDKQIGSSALERWPKLAPILPRGSGRSAHHRERGPKLLSHLVLLRSALFFWPLKLLGEGRGRKVCFQLVSEGWSETSVSQGTTETVFVRAGSVKSSLRGSVCHRMELGLTSTISHSGHFPGPEWRTPSCQAPPAPKGQHDGPGQTMGTPAANPTAPDIFGASWNPPELVTLTPPPPGSLP